MDSNKVIDRINNFCNIIFHILKVRTPHTMEHVQRVPIIANMIANAINKYTTTNISKDDLLYIDIAAKLHDCGKTTTADYLLEKSTKTEFPRNRIHEIRNRFEILQRDAEIAYLKKIIKHPELAQQAKKQFKKQVETLHDEFSFLAECNIGDTAVTPTEIKRLTNIGKKKFKRYFSRLAGLSWYEKNQLTAEQKDTYTKSYYENLIQDNPEDIYKDIPTGELHNLSIYKGTISAQERKKVEQHAQETENILKMLKLPKELKNIVTYASEHHEQPCGKGYPKGLTEEQLSIPSRIMTIADIFEALTSSGRPYKTPKKLSEALKIMKIMKNKKQIDDKIYTLCLEKGIFIKYANKYLSPDQLDITDVSDFY